MGYARDLAGRVTAVSGAAEGGALRGNRLPREPDGGGMGWEHSHGGKRRVTRRRPPDDIDGMAIPPEITKSTRRR
jgi:hypothetical protein